MTTVIIASGTGCRRGTREVPCTYGGYRLCSKPMTILVTGATGYVGGRLVPALLDAGHRVRCLARDAGRLAGRRCRVSWKATCSARLAATRHAGRGRRVYLVHSMGSGTGFERDIAAASNFSATAPRVRRIVYLGGLGDDSAALSSFPPGGQARSAPPSSWVPGFVRDDPPPRRTNPGDGVSALGLHQDAADRDRRRGPLSRGRAGVR